MKLRLLSWILPYVRRDVEVEFMGSRFVVSPHDLIGRCLILGHGFETQTLQRATEIMERGGTFIDIGANIGLYSVILAQRTEVRCVAIEPSPLTFNYLCRNAALNNATNVTLVNGALAGVPGVLPMRQWCVGNYGTLRVTGTDHNGAQGKDVTFHLALPLGDVLRDLGITSVRCLKIDVEGFEMNIFDGLDFYSPLRPEHIICEFIEPVTLYAGRGRMDLFEFLIARDYRATDVTGRPIPDFDSSYMPPEYNLVFSSSP